MKTCKNLQRWLQFKDRYCNSKFLFPKKDGLPIEVTSFESGFTKYLGRAGINKDYSPHAIRTQTGKMIARQNPNFKDGRPKKYTLIQIEHALSLLSAGKSCKEVEAITGISKSTLLREKKQYISA
ncbi:MAG: helix-turn-helix domain-containing protein [Oscillospiraceae bacterium]|nr:helix-turn-helix domain-containing protein [Oscillospiraceae bacterium]